MGILRPVLFKLSAYTVAAAVVGFVFLSINETEKKLMPHGNSMLPSVEPGKVIVASRDFDSVERGSVFIINQNKTQLKTQNTPDGPYIKRVLGIPGDHIQLSLNDGSLLYVNGEPVNYALNDAYPSFSFNSKRDGMEDQNIPSLAYTVSIGGASFPAYFADNNVFASSSISEFAKIVFDYPWLKNQDVVDGMYSVKIPEQHYYVASDNYIGEDSRHFGLIHRSAFIYEYKG